MKNLILLILLLLPISCSDDYMTIERNIIDAENKIPIYFYAEPEQSNDANTWRPVFTYYIYSMNEGIYDAYFHAYCMMEDSVIWSGIQPIEIEGRKKIWGTYTAEYANFNPEWIINVTPMAYVSEEYE